MDVDVVVDVGNSRIKWGRCAGNAVVELTALPHDDPSAWQAQGERWKLVPGMTWVVSGVAPKPRDALIDWLRHQSQTVHLLDSHRQLPLKVLVDAPEQVGIDRLLNVVAANARREAGMPAMVIDAGSAVTLNWIDAAGAYRGGAIFPGLRLMAQALHDHTAMLPLVSISDPVPSLPARDTLASIQAGIYWAVVGGIRALLERKPERPATLFLAGGDAALLAPALRPVVLWPEITLEGIRLAAANWP